MAATIMIAVELIAWRNRYLATLMLRLGPERLANAWVRTGSFAPGRKICTLIVAMLAGATHIDGPP